MAYQVVGDVLHHAPAGVTGTDRLLLVALAELVHQSDVTARRCRAGLDDLARMTGMARGSVKDALARLATRGLDVRVPLGTDRHGRPLYAVRGQVPTFQLPTFQPAPDCSCGPCVKGRRSSPLDAQGATTAARRGDDGGQKGRQVPPEGATTAALYRDTGGAGEQGAATIAPAGPRCPRHADIVDDDAVPPCRACRAVRLAAPAPPTRSTSAGPRPLPPLCGGCEALPGDPPAMRQRELPDGRVERCPDCHPAEVRRAS